MIFTLLLLFSIYYTVYMTFNIARFFVERQNFSAMPYISLALAFWADIMFIIFICLSLNLK